MAILNYTTSIKTEKTALDIEIKCYSSVQAFLLFINRYKEIKNDQYNKNF